METNGGVKGTPVRRDASHRKIIRHAVGLGAETSLVYKSAFADESIDAIYKSMRETYALYERLAQLVKSARNPTHEVEWIFDNLYIVQGAANDILKSLDRKEWRKLPQIAIGSNVRQPRIYSVLSELLLITDEKIDRNTLAMFLLSYQRSAPLSVRELHIVPLTLKILLVEHVQSILKQTVKMFEEYEDAERWYRRIMLVARKDANASLAKISSELTNVYGILPIHFGSYLIQRLTQEGPHLRPVLKWLRLNLLKQGVRMNNLGDVQSRERAKNSVRVAHIIDSLRFVNQSRWDTFVEEVNIIDTILAKDPSGHYGRLDPKSKEQYRHVIMKMSERTGIEESLIARHAKDLALGAAQKQNDPIHSARMHIGYYLVDDGRTELEKKIEYIPTRYEKAVRNTLAKPFIAYFGLVSFFVLLFTWIELYVLLHFFEYGVGAAAIITILLLIINSESAVRLTSFVLVRVIPQRTLSRLDLTQCVEEERATFVVIPSMLRSIGSSRRLVDKIETYFLANRDDHVYFALLMDFRDAKTESTEQDQILFEDVEKRIELLNNKYPAPVPHFKVLVRKRLWNEKEGIYMGWERKRGKLREFNMLLRGSTETSYINASRMEYPHIRYVITLDEDTELTRDAAKGLIGSIDHPLNRPLLDHVSGKVIRGYGIVQPKVSSRISEAYTSWFSRLYIHAVGIDSYSSSGADVYQDLFGTGIFYGKGIYDIDVVESTMAGKIPDNSVLSHDLLEGIYTRVGVASDVQVFDGFPSSFHEYSMRLLRWIRGDWQIIPWLFSRGKASKFGKIDEWKIFDNMRRTVVPIAAVILVLFSIKSGVRGEAVYFGVLLFGMYVANFFVPLIGLIKQDKRATLGEHFVSWGRTLWMNIVHVFLGLVFLLFNAYLSARAIGVTLFRVYISKKHLLQWQSSIDVSESLKGSIVEFYRSMWATQAVPALYIAYAFYHPASAFSGTAWLSVWILSPAIGAVLSIPRSRRVEVNNGKHRAYMRRVAVRTARYFLEQSNESVKWLIPDHVSFADGVPRSNLTATSPTNLGMLMTAYVGAHKMGYLGLGGFVTRTTRSIESLASLDRFKGHLYNWYDVKEGTALPPRYVSSVDSANFIVALTAFKKYLEELCEVPVVPANCMQGVFEYARMGSEDVDGIQKKTLPAKARKDLAAIRRTLKHIVALSDTYISIRNIQTLRTWTNRVQEEFEILGDVLMQAPDDRLRDLLQHIQSIIAEADDAIREFAPWTREELREGERRARVLFADRKTFWLIFDTIPTMRDIQSGTLFDVFRKEDLKSSIDAFDIDEKEKYALKIWCDEVEKSLDVSKNNVEMYMAKIQYISGLAERLISEPDFTFLYNKERGLFHIGYNADFNKIDNAYYDFLASEANSVSMIAISRGHAPLKHWFYLGRKHVRLQNTRALSSWGGSLFEYLTSLLFFRAHDESMLGKTARGAISAHIRYGRKHRVPWGMGESAYSSMDSDGNYKYQIFGEPQLGLKRGLRDFLVIAPYTTVLSLPYRTNAALKNLMRLERAKAWGLYGFYDAIDYTEAGMWWRTGVPSKIHYAHHQGFILISIANILHQNMFKELFHNDARIRATDVLLEERAPEVGAEKPLDNIPQFEAELAHPIQGDTKEYVPVKTDLPRYSFISNGEYSVRQSNSGVNMSMWKDTVLTYTRPGKVVEEGGTSIYIRDLKDSTLWSPTLLPTGVQGKKNKILYRENRTIFEKHYNSIGTQLEVVVSADEPVEIRELTITNNSEEPRALEIASYGEVALAGEDQFIQHPAFQKIFIASEYNPRYKALIFNRPEHDDRTRRMYLSHQITGLNKKESVRPLVNREHFIGRLGTPASPVYFKENAERNYLIEKYSLDPIFSLSSQIKLGPKESRKISFLTIAGDDQTEVVHLMKKYSKYKTIRHAKRLSARYAERTLSEIGITAHQSLVFQSLISSVLSSRPRPRTDTSKAPLVHSLWKIGISGDIPLVVLKVNDVEDVPAVKQTLQWRSYAHMKQIPVDVVILNQYPASYIKTVDDEIDYVVRAATPKGDSAGKIHHVKSDLLSPEDLSSLLAAATIVLDAHAGSIESQIVMLREGDKHQLMPKITPSKKPLTKRHVDIAKKKLVHENGYGGFDPITGEYVLYVRGTIKPPRPWVNIISNGIFGTTVSETGSMHTWAENSHDNRLTLLDNDSLVDHTGEALYIRDEDTGEVWSPLPGPLMSQSLYEVRHGKGYSSFTLERFDVQSTSKVFVPPHEKVKLITVELANVSKQAKRLSQFAYFDVVMGVNKRGARNVRVWRDERTGAVGAQNDFRNNFADSVAVFDIGADSDMTADKTEFLGQNGSLSAPAAMKRTKLSNSLESTEECVTLRKEITVMPGETVQCVIIVGEVKDPLDIAALIEKYRNPAVVAEAFEKTQTEWELRTGTISIKTPDATLDLLVNHWLPYQALSSRLFAKSGYNQPGGAYGFRDQLQDVMALIPIAPEFASELIRKASAHQFLEGDVMNWWHEYNNFGVRTLFSDQHLWLPYVLSEYIQITGDASILDHEEPYVEAPLVEVDGEHSWAGVPTVSEHNASVYEHAVRAIERSLATGKHGLPLIGAGDWNDGLNAVGIHGRGESVWLGWFLYFVLTAFVPIAESRGEAERAERFKEAAINLKSSLDQNAWDGKWYVRAFFDNGMPLGTAKSREFKIDAIAQAWSVLSGAGDPEKSSVAVESAKTKLTTTTRELALLAPPVSKSSLNPGYIKDYPPGVRENGAQYNHGALWLAQAFAKQGNGDAAYDILSMVNPVLRSETKTEADRYRAEPYVVAADVYTGTHAGRGGWTWYTGSAGMLYRTVVEYILGFTKRGEVLVFNPSLPTKWNEFTLSYKYKTSIYDIAVKKKESGKSITYTVDGERVDAIRLVDDGRLHHVKVDIV